VLDRDGHECTNCHATQFDGATLHTHHLTYCRRGRERLSDLITLCQNCHEQYHDRGENGLAECVDIIHWRGGQKSAMRRIAI
jgi:5-methylcytosine-specific restriction endonuclease McrA